MPARLLNCLEIGLAALLAFPRDARAEIDVMMSGGFALAYQELLREFERTTGLKVVATSGASQGTDRTTIKAQIERGACASNHATSCYPDPKGWAKLRR